MNYKFIYDSDEFIVGYYSVFEDEPYDFIGDLDDYPGIDGGWCKLLKGEIVEDLDKKAQILENEAKVQEINILQSNLNETDYIIARTFEEIMSLDNSLTFATDFIKILKKFKTQYAETLANRKSWRERISELKGE